MEKRVFGDKLPGATIDDKEWKRLRKYWLAQEKPLTIEGKQRLNKRFVELRAKFCVGENKSTCWLCGGKTTEVHLYGLCSVCRRAFVNRGIIRQAGTVHACKHKNVLCAACEKKPATSLGVCRRCFNLMKQKEFINHEELKLYYKKIEQHSLGAKGTLAPLTQIR